MAKLTPSESILQEAQRLVDGPRQEAYDHPLDAFSAVGRVWGAILDRPDIPAETVALMMAGMKLVREARHAKRDNRIDAAGYLYCEDLCIDELERRA